MLGSLLLWFATLPAPAGLEPTPWQFDVVRACPAWLREDVLLSAMRGGWYSPDVEPMSFADREDFVGALHMIYRRSVGRPFQAPIDPFGPSPWWW